MEPSTVSRAAKRLELAIARVLFASRWLLVPIYLGLALLLVLLVFRFGQEFVHIALRAVSGSDVEFRGWPPTPLLRSRSTVRSSNSVVGSEGLPFGNALTVTRLSEKGSGLGSESTTPIRYRSNG